MSTVSRSGVAGPGVVDASEPTPSADAPTLELLYREGCHLCDDMRELLEELLPAGSYRLVERDIDLEPALRAVHDVRVPVLLLAGEELCHHFLDLAAVREALAGYTRELREA